MIGRAYRTDNSSQAVSTGECFSETGTVSYGPSNGQEDRCTKISGTKNRSNTMEQIEHKPNGVGQINGEDSWQRCSKQMEEVGVNGD